MKKSRVYTRVASVNDLALGAMIDAHHLKEFEDVRAGHVEIIKKPVVASKKELVKKAIIAALAAKEEKRNDQRTKARENLELLGGSTSQWVDKVREKQKAARRKLRGAPLLSEKEKQKKELRYKKGQKPSLSRKALKRLEHQSLKVKIDTTALESAAKYKKLLAAAIKMQEIKDAITEENVFANLSAKDFVESEEPEIIPEIWDKYMTTEIVLVTWTLNDKAKAR